MILRDCKILDLGLMDYQTAYEKQLELVRNIKAGVISDTLVLVEHLDVYTYGRKSKEPIPAHLPNVIAVERGGEATFHNPGQLVAYPILSLQEGERDVHSYLRRLEDLAIAVLERFGVKGERRSGATGVWIQGKQKKIASIGVAFSSWVSYHGIALNVENDLSGFQNINPCGFDASVMTSIKAELLISGSLFQKVRDVFVEEFPKYFRRNLA